MKRTTVAIFFTGISTTAVAGNMSLLPAAQGVPALGGWGLGLLAVAVGGLVYRWFRSKDRD